jgi:hypothetical protein
MLEEMGFRIRGMAWLAMMVIQAGVKSAVEVARTFEERGRQGRLPKN